MSTRDEILARLRSQSRSVTPPAPWRSHRQFDDLAEQFTKALTAAQGEVRRANNLEEALDQVTAIFSELGVQTAIANAQSPLDLIDLAGGWPEVNWHVVGKKKRDDPATAGESADENLRNFGASADIGLSGADAALAETGTIVVSSGPGQSRLTTLLPPVHLALVPTSSLTTDLFTWTAARRVPLPASVTLISGPSKTADIEQTMATGVHGPKRFIVILYDD